MGIPHPPLCTAIALRVDATHALDTYLISVFHH